MNKNRIVRAAIFSGGLLLAAVAQAETASPEALAYTCAGCHGTNGVSNGPATPTLAGMHETYLSDTMIAYRDGERPSTIMTRIAKGYNDEEIAAMSSFFAKQEYVPAEQSAEGNDAKKGAKLHKKYCEKCHSENGTLADDESGFLSGQWLPYLHYSMDDFLNGDREMTKKMAKKVKEMRKKEGDDAFKTLTDFYGNGQ